MSTICLTVGNGIGAEISAKFLIKLPLAEVSRLLIFGNIIQLQETARQLNLTLPDGLNTVHIDGSDGRVAYHAIEQSVACIASGQALSLLTGPISKEALHSAGYAYGGHTEILDVLTHRHWPEWKTSAEMLFVYEQFRLMLLTRHIPLQAVPAALNQLFVEASLKTLVRFLQQQAGILVPKIALMGLNPHAGEIGGDEEAHHLIPAGEAVNQQTGAHISQPLAADALFRGFQAQSPTYDAYVACYHDQGLIPFKLVAGYQAVNVTIGLPFIRASVSHGTAPDIVGQNLADPSSLLAAYRFLNRQSVTLV